MAGYIEARVRVSFSRSERQPNPLVASLSEPGWIATVYWRPNLLALHAPPLTEDSRPFETYWFNLQDLEVQVWLELAPSAVKDSYQHPDSKATVSL